MNYLADILIATLELVQAEFRQAKQQFVRLGVALGLVLAAAAMLTAGGLLLIYALYTWLASILPAALAACLCGLSGLLIAWLLITLALRYADEE